MKRHAKLQIGDLELTLRMNFLALKRLKEETGVDLLKQGEAAKLSEVDVLPAAIWAFAGAEKQPHSIDEIAEEMDPREIGTYVDAIGRMISPDPSSESAPAEAPAAAETRSS